jgi:hypothetical protein
MKFHYEGRAEGISTAGDNCRRRRNDASADGGTWNAAAGSIVVASLKKIDAFTADPVDQTVFLGDAP